MKIEDGQNWPSSIVDVMERRSPSHSLCTASECTLLAWTMIRSVGFPIAIAAHLFHSNESFLPLFIYYFYYWIIDSLRRWHGIHISDRQYMESAIYIHSIYFNLRHFNGSLLKLDIITMEKLTRFFLHSYTPTLISLVLFQQLIDSLVRRSVPSWPLTQNAQAVA